MPGKLEGKVALVTGGSAGIGLATARDLADDGAHVYITGRRQRELDEAAASIGPGVTAIRGDVASLADLDRIYAQIGQEEGRVDVVFANAGIGELVPFGSITEEHFDHIFTVNVNGVVFTAQKPCP
jgi:NAD(P)-dependent dehydrogenase (short-subunit alcohol dehydrogenase family)